MSFVQSDAERAYGKRNENRHLNIFICTLERAQARLSAKRGVPPVLSHSSRQIFISAASATSEIRIRSLTHDERVSYMFPGSTVVSEPKTIKISREECVGR